MSASRRFDGIGCCIYCGARDCKLGEEHIIGRAFGGVLVMDSASCSDCERITSGIETRCATSFFGPAKSYFGIKGRKSRRVPTRVMLYLGGAGNAVKTSVPSEDHPSVMWLFGFEGPGLFVGRPPEEKIGVQFIQIRLAPDWQARLTKLGGSIAMPNIAPKVFGQLLAKTAHAYAMAAIPGAFTPCLVDHIRGTATLPLSHYMGRRIQPEGVGNTLHEIELHQETIADGRSFWFVRLRLFATIADTPIHDIIVGEAIDQGDQHAVPLNQ